MDTSTSRREEGKGKKYYMKYPASSGLTLTVDSEAVCKDGDVIVRGINTPNLIAGYIEICFGGEWRALCATGKWNQNAATVTCRQLGLPEGKWRYV